MKRTKKVYLDIAMNDWEQRLIVRNNQDAESHVTEDQGSSGETMWLEKAMRSRMLMRPRLFFIKEPRR